MTSQEKNFLNALMVQDFANKGKMIVNKLK